jgi:thiol-disulfide isomerase/thioredoxin
MIGKKANEFMLSNLSAPAGTGTQANFCKLTPPALSAITGGKPTVIAFFAPWIEQCAKLDDLMKQAQAQFPNRVSWRTIDVSDSSNDDIVKAFDVGPVPTVVFLKPDGTISSTIIGQSSFVAIAKGIAQMMH